MPLTLELSCPEAGWQFEAHSLLRNFMALLYIQARQTTQSLQDENGTVWTDGPNSNNFAIGPPADQFINGIIPGSGTAPVDIEDFSLAAKIQNGAGAGQLTYGASQASAPIISGSTCFITISKTFTNNSGADITINEVGCLFLLTTVARVLGFREVVPPTTIPSGQARTITLTITITA